MLTQWFSSDNHHVEVRVYGSRSSMFRGARRMSKEEKSDYNALCVCYSLDEEGTITRLLFHGSSIPLGSVVHEVSHAVNWFMFQNHGFDWVKEQELEEHCAESKGSLSEVIWCWLCSKGVAENERKKET